MEEASTATVEGAAGVREVVDALQQARDSAGTADARAIYAWTAANHEPTTWPMWRLQQTTLARVVLSQ